MKENGWCRYCQRIRGHHCRNSRDMDPEDGFNFDPACHDALVKIGGGERMRSPRELALLRVDHEYPPETTAK